jgi:hypothetical protein
METTIRHHLIKVVMTKVVMEEMEEMEEILMEGMVEIYLLNG